MQPIMTLGQEIVIPPPTSTFPEVIDNSMRSAFTKCGQQFLRQYVQHLRMKGTNVHLHAGGAFAKGLEVTRKAYFDQGKPAQEAENEGLQALYTAYGDPDDMEEARNADKTLPGMVRAFESYWLEYPLGKDYLVPHKAQGGQSCVEFSFAQIIPELLHPETGMPLLYCGRFDVLAEMKGALFVQDEKTASQLGEQWKRNWDLDSQFTSYIWGAKTFGYPVAGAVIRGIGLLKTKTTHEEVITYRGQWQIDRWLEQLIRDVKRMIESWKENYYDYALDKSACNAFGGCSYRTLCDSPSPENWIDTHYQRVVWNPLTRD